MDHDHMAMMNMSGEHGSHHDHSMHQGMDHSMHRGMDHSMHRGMDHSMHRGMDHSMHQGMGHASMNHHMDRVAVSLDHSGMDHGAHQAAAAGDTCGGGHAMHGMSMFFHGGYCETVLFEIWKISSIGGLVGSVIGIIIMAALYEGLKYYREYLLWKMYNALQRRDATLPAEKNVIVDDNRVVQPTMLSWMHTIQTLLHIVQILLSYFLMLIFMTYNVWLCLAVSVGGAIGYFLFGWKKTVIVDVTEHCH